MTDISAEPGLEVSPEEGAKRLGDWGFLAHGDLPDGPGPAYLVVALRCPPTLRHFDPEAIEFWVTEAGRGTRCAIDGRAAAPSRRPFAWGRIRIVDRLGVANEFATFGGDLAVDRVGDAVVCAFSSAAPLLRLGGHSQICDELGADVAAFFARLLVTIGAVPGFEARLAAASPLAMYAAFLEDATRRFGRAAALAATRRTIVALVSAERRRIGASDAVDFRVGAALTLELHRHEGRVSP